MKTPTRLSFTRHIIPLLVYTPKSSSSTASIPLASGVGSKALKQQFIYFLLTDVNPRCIGASHYALFWEAQETLLHTDQLL